MLLHNEYVPTLKRDYTYYNSSNLVYTECEDNENEYKTLYVMYKNGTVYRYDDVNVFDYLFIRNAPSQGKEAYQKLKPYKYEKIGQLNPDEVIGNLQNIQSSDYVIYKGGGKLTMTDGRKNPIYETDESNEDVVTSLLNAVEKTFVIKNAKIEEMF